MVDIRLRQTKFIALFLERETAGYHDNRGNEQE
jgi:hypothetical protein